MLYCGDEIATFAARRGAHVSRALAASVLFCWRNSEGRRDEAEARASRLLSSGALHCTARRFKKRSTISVQFQHLNDVAN